MKLPAPLVKTWQDIQLNFDALGKGTSTPDRRLYKQITPVGVIDLGSFDGENITGVRITANLITSGTGGDTVIRLRPNGSNSVLVQHLVRRTYWNGASQLSDNLYGANHGVSLGLVVAAHNWAVNANAVSFDGIFHTNRLGVAHYRRWLGRFTNEDYVSNDNQWVSGDSASVWKDTVTPVTGLTLAIDSGAMLGRVSVEVIP